MHVSGHEAVVRMNEFPSTAVQAGLLEGRRIEVETKRGPVKPSSFLPAPQPRSEVMKERGSGGRGCHITLSTLGPPPQSLHLLSVQSSVVQAGHTALEAQFCHPIVDQQEVSQLREKGTKTSPPPRLLRDAQPASRSGVLACTPGNKLPV